MFKILVFNSPDLLQKSFLIFQKLEEVRKELPKYQNNREKYKLMAKPEQEFKDPFGVQAYLAR